MKQMETVEVLIAPRPHYVGLGGQWNRFGNRELPGLFGKKRLSWVQ